MIYCYSQARGGSHYCGLERVWRDWLSSTEIEIHITHMENASLPARKGGELLLKVIIADASRYLHSVEVGGARYLSGL